MSSTAVPSRRNSGTDAMWKLTDVCFLMMFLTWLLVPGGTVDFIMIMVSFLRWGAADSAAAKTADRSAVPSGAEGVPTAIMMTSAAEIALG